MKTIMLNDTVKLVLGAISLMEIFQNTFEDGRKSTSAYLTQDRDTIYPSKDFGTGHGEGLFDNPDGNVYSRKRHCLLPVPENATEDQIAGQLVAFPDATLVNILSNNVEDVVGSKIKRAVASGLTDLESQRAKFVIRDKEGFIYANYTREGVQLEEDARKVGKIITDEAGKTVGMEIWNEDAVLEYKTTYFSREYKADEDLREYVTKNSRIAEVPQEAAIEAAIVA